MTYSKQHIVGHDREGSGKTTQKKMKKKKRRLKIVILLVDVMLQSRLASSLQTSARGWAVGMQDGPAFGLDPRNAVYDSIL